LNKDFPFASLYSLFEDIVLKHSAK